MRSIAIGAVVAAGLSLAGAVPTVSAPANVAAIGRAAADVAPVTQARCWCRWRGWRGYCRRWRCWWDEVRRGEIIHTSSGGTGAASSMLLAQW